MARHSQTEADSWWGDWRQWLAELFRRTPTCARNAVATNGTRRLPMPPAPTSLKCNVWLYVLLEHYEFLFAQPLREFDMESTNTKSLFAEYPVIRSVCCPGLTSPPCWSGGARTSRRSAINATTLAGVQVARSKAGGHVKHDCVTGQQSMVTATRHFSTQAFLKAMGELVQQVAQGLVERVRSGEYGRHDAVRQLCDRQSASRRTSKIEDIFATGEVTHREYEQAPTPCAAPRMTVTWKRKCQYLSLFVTCNIQSVDLDGQTLRVGIRRRRTIPCPCLFSTASART